MSLKRIINSGMGSATDSCPQRRSITAALALLLALVPGSLRAVEGDFAAPVMQRYLETENRYRREPQVLEAAWQYAQACFDLAEFSTNSTERAAIAQQGIAASRQAASKDPGCGPARYYLGMNLGQLARTRGLGALKLVNEMEREFKKAAELDPKFDHAGADRSLGVLYRDAPAIASVGSRTKARRHLERAVKLAPDFPENRLALIEACLGWHDRVVAQREFKALQEMLPAARAKFQGPEWRASWADWNQRIAEIQTGLKLPPKLQSPRH